MSFLTPESETNQISHEDLIEALKKVKKKNDDFRKSLRHPKDCKIRCCKINF